MRITSSATVDTGDATRHSIFEPSKHDWSTITDSESLIAAYKKSAPHSTVYVGDMSFDTTDPDVLDRIAAECAVAAHDLRVVLGYKTCDGCLRLVARTWPRDITVGRGADDASLGGSETVQVCADCGGVDPAEVDGIDDPIAQVA